MNKETTQNQTDKKGYTPPKIEDYGTAQQQTQTGDSGFSNDGVMGGSS